jgi:hypothetical protein
MAFLKRMREHEVGEQAAIGGFLIRHAEPEEILILPSIERRAVRQFEGWFAETGLTRAVLEDVSTLEELENARLRGHLWVALAPSRRIGHPSNPE